MCLIKCFVSATGTSCTGRLCYIAFTSNRSFTFSLLAGDGDLNFNRVGALLCTNKDCNSCFCSAALNLLAVLLALFAAALFNCACFFLPLLPLEPSHLFSQCEPAKPSLTEVGAASCFSCCCDFAICSCSWNAVLHLHAVLLVLFAVCCCARSTGCCSPVFVGMLTVIQ